MSLKDVLFVRCGDGMTMDEPLSITLSHYVDVGHHLPKVVISYLMPHLGGHGIGFVSDCRLLP